MRYGLVPGLGAGVAVAQLGARKAAEEIHYQRWVKTNFERIAGAAKTTAENEDQALRNVRKLIEKIRIKTATSSSTRSPSKMSLMFFTKVA